mmetsp:Transcript_33964/g.62900  ORF Transcript_33964/g.62900 Transcript_33964/m.62900 type:complete len:82 (+) Transcript_33964:259-504(+)
MMKALASFDASLAVAVFAKPPTKPASPVRFRAGPCFPVRKENVVAHVGQATRGMSGPNASSVTIVPLYRSKAQRGQVPSTA